MLPLILSGLGATAIIVSWIGHHREPTNLPQMNFQDIQLVAEGVLKGALEVEGLNDILECVEDSEKVTIDVRRAVAHLSQHNLDGVINGLQDLSDALIAVHDGIKVCHPGEFKDELE